MVMLINLVPNEMLLVAPSPEDDYSYYSAFLPLAATLRGVGGLTGMSGQLGSEGQQ